MENNTPHNARPECLEKMLKLEAGLDTVKRDINEIDKEIIDIHKSIEKINNEKIEKGKEEIQMYKQRFFWLLTSIISILGGGLGIFLREFIKNLLNN